MNGALGNDTLFGGAGDDTIGGGEGSDQIFAGPGNDFAYGGYGDDLVRGGAGADTLVGVHEGNDSGNDTLDGGAGNDMLYGYARSTMIGGAGDDLFHSGFDAAETEISTVTDFTPGEDRIEITIYGPEVTPGFVVQAQGDTDTVILVDGIPRMILSGITPAQVKPTAISVSHIN